MSPDGTRLAIGGQTRLAAGPMVREKVGGATVWDATTGLKQLSLADGHTLSVGYIAYSTDGTRLATTSGDATVQVWNAKTVEKLLDLEGHSEGVLCVGFSPDGSRLVTGSSDGTVRLWNGTTGKEERKIEIEAEIPAGVKNSKLDDIARTQFSPDGEQLWGVGYSGFWTWDAATGDEIRSHRFQTAVNDPDLIAIHPGSNRLATAHMAELNVRDLTTGEFTRQFRILPAFVLNMSGAKLLCIAFSPDGTRIVGGTADGAIWVWKLNE